MFSKLIKKLLPKKHQQPARTTALSEQNEEWTYFKRYSGDDYYLVLVNVGLLKQNQIISECWFELKYHFLLPQLSGGWMPTPAVAEAYGTFEHAVDESIRVVGGRQAACITGDGIRRALYCAPNLQLEDILRKQASAARELPVEVRPTTYSQYEDLLPTRLESKLKHNEQMLKSLNDHGDDGMMEREVMHWITNVSGINIMELCHTLRSLGYSIEEATNDHIRFSRLTSLSLESTAEETENLLAFCCEIGCEYDGWETPVVRSTMH